MNVLCAVCSAKTDANLCARHTEDLTKILAELPAWLDELTFTMTGQAKTSGHDNSKPTKKFEQPLPYHSDAAQLLDEARNGLGSWVRHIAEVRGLTTGTIRTTQDMARWLLAAIDAIRVDEAAGELHASMTALHLAIRQRVDNTAKRWAGPCTAKVIEYELQLVVVDGWEISAEVGKPLGPPRECGADLRTRPGAARIVCAECGTVYNPVERARWIITQSAEHQGTAAFIAAALTDAGRPMKRNTITKWAERGKLFAWREDDLGRPLYRVGDVLDILDQDRHDTAEKAG